MRSEKCTKKPVANVFEHRPHDDGCLQLEVRRGRRKDGSVKENGFHWPLYYYEDGKQRMLYLGRTDDPEGLLKQERTPTPKQVH